MRIGEIMVLISGAIVIGSESEICPVVNISIEVCIVNLLVVVQRNSNFCGKCFPVDVRWANVIGRIVTHTHTQRKTLIRRIYGIYGVVFRIDFFFHQMIFGSHQIAVIATTLMAIVIDVFIYLFVSVCCLH